MGFVCLLAACSAVRAFAACEEDGMQVLQVMHCCCSVLSAMYNKSPTSAWCVLYSRMSLSCFTVAMPSLMLSVHGCIVSWCLKACCACHYQSCETHPQSLASIPISDPQ